MRQPLGISGELLVWYDKHQRDLPWRPRRGTAALPDPYRVMVSEVMLQQTQVATVLPYFNRFVLKWPTLRALARAPEQEVLRMWQGLGYYSRARNLRNAARVIVSQLGGRIPRDPDELIKLPGIGRYTAGAIASLAFDVRAAVLDGNVTRVLCRLDAIRRDPRHPRVRERLWSKAEVILPNSRVGDFNSALMELGATVCMPRTPKCGECPLRGHCRARAAGVVERIPKTASAKVRPLLRRWTLCIERGGKWLIEKRPSKGRWAGMWQFVTVEAGNGELDARGASRLAGVGLRDVRPIGAIAHELTHRRYEIAVYRARAAGGRRRDAYATERRWVTLDDLAAYPMPRPQTRIAQMLR